MKIAQNIQKGFPLIKLLIVIAVIGVLAVGAITIINPLSQIQKAQDARRKSDLSQIQKAIEQYYQNIGSYPPYFAASDYRIKGLDGNAVNWGDSWLPYISTMPSDPSSSKNYVYFSTGQTYYIYATLDRGANDSQVCNGGAACSSLPVGASCGVGTVCNYGVSSPNVSP